MQEKVKKWKPKSGNFPTSPDSGSIKKNSDLEDVMVSFKKKTSPLRNTRNTFGACWTPKIQSRYLEKPTPVEINKSVLSSPKTDDWPSIPVVKM